MKLTLNQLKKIVSESINNETTIYCDMDGVIADFVTGVVQLINYYLSYASSGQQIESKSLRKALNKVLNAYGKNFRIQDHNIIVTDKLIKRLKYIVVVQNPGKFFYELPGLVDGTELLWPYITSLGLPVKILSAPINSRKGMSATQGKTMWVRENLSPQPVDIHIVPAVEKQNFATSATGVANVLIDDKLETINQWNAAGGIGILHIPGESALTIKQINSLGF